MEVPFKSQGENCLCCDKKSPLLSMLTSEEIERIHHHRHKVIFKKGETICKQGTPVSHVLSLNDGLAKLFLEGVDNRTSIIKIVKSAGFVGGPGIFVDRIYHNTLTALIDTTVCFIDLAHFIQLIEQNKMFAHAYMEYFCNETLSVYKRLINLTQKQVPGRMADTLIYLSEEIYEAKKFSLDLSKQDLADLSGMSKDSAMKVLRDFLHSGIINFCDHELEILSPNKLAKISRIG